MRYSRTTLSKLKAFTPEQIEEIFARQNYRCARCDKPGGLEAHHKKARSQLTRKDLARGNGGGVGNGVGLCPPCHRAVHDYRENTEQFRTKSWEEIGGNNGPTA